jgi:hypothetical protein
MSLSGAAAGEEGFGIVVAHAHVCCSAGAALASIKQQRRGLKSAGTMSGSSEAGTFVNDIPDYEQGLDFEACDWLDDVDNDNQIGGAWEGAMQEHRLSAAARSSSGHLSLDMDDNATFDKTITYKDVHVYTRSQAAAQEQLRGNSRAAAVGPERPRTSWSSFSMLDSIYLPKSSRPRGALSCALVRAVKCLTVHTSQDTT